MDKIELCCSLKEEMNALGLKDGNIFKILIVWYDPNKEGRNKGVNKDLFFKNRIAII
ncbi:hypothetical protein [Bacillus cereus]|uniref:hypothetical protein n=1 Tax=Bacillus cereus TaxID=1396 RepID=UPI003D65AB3A